MSETEFQLLRAAAFTLAVGLAVALERMRPHMRRPGSLRTNVSLWAVDAALLGAVCGGCACAVARWASAAGVGALNAVAAPLWIAVPVTVASLDLVSYLWHRANHTVPALWRFHAVHHSDPIFTASTALRFHPGELLLSLPVRLVAVVLLGAPAVAIVVFEALFAFANFFEHADIDLPLDGERVVDRVVVTPALHRFHHTRTPVERDHNFGTILVLWDRLLGTYRPSSSAARVDVGLPEVGERLGLQAALLLPWRREVVR